jgi:integrase
MQAKPSGVDQWLMQPFKRGAGVFVGRITSTGERLFYFRYTDSRGRRPFLPIGPYHPRGVGGMTLAAAFKKATELSALYQSGIRDLREHFEREREAAEAALRQAQHSAEEAQRAAERRLTVRGLFEAWQRAELRPQVLADGTRTGRKDGGEWVRQAFERRVFPALGDAPADQVKRADLLAIIDHAKAGGTLRTAQVLLTDLRQMFRFAVEREVVPHNPLDGIKRSKVGRAVERDRVLSDAELQALARAQTLARMSPRSAAAVWLILATGVRVGEAMGAVWAAESLDVPALTKVADDAGAKFGVIDMAARTWHLPTTKNERAHTVHLSDFALARLSELAALREMNDRGKPVPWVFPATDRTRPVCVKSFGKQLADRQRGPERRMSRRSKRSLSLALPGGKWTAHDLRRTSATIMARLGFSTDVIDECLNHKLQSKVARVYIQDRRRGDQARAFDALGSHLGQLVGKALADSHDIGRKSPEISTPSAASSARRRARATPSHGQERPERLASHEPPSPRPL